MMHYEHLVRRGMAAMRDNGPEFDNDLPPSVVKMQQVMQEMPQWGMVVMAITLLAGLLLIASTRYTLQGVIPTLAMVESNQSTVIVRNEKAKYDSADALAEEAIDSEVIVIRQTPVTAKIRSTIRHLQARAGFASRWRGLHVMAVWGLSYMVLKSALASLASPLFSVLDPDTFHMVLQPVSAVLSRVLLARLGLTWTHVVISESSSKSWYRRIPSRKAWKQIAAPTFFTAAAWQLSYIMPAGAAFAVGLVGDNNPFTEQDSPECMMIKLLAVAGIAIATFVGITIPCEVALTRVQASMLPEEDESIIPFDRTFGGAVRPEILGGSGKLGFVEAWATFDYAARVRLLKLYVKVFAVDAALHLIVGLVLIAELVMIMGPKLQEIFASVQLDGMAESRYKAVTY